MINNGKENMLPKYFRKKMQKMQKKMFIRTIYNAQERNASAGMFVL